MDEIKGIRIVSLTGKKEYGIEDSEAREELANVVDGAPEELDSFKEAFEKFKEGGEALAGIAAEVAAVGKAVTDETTRAQAAEEDLDRKITDEVGRAKEVENELANAITEESKATDEKIATEIDKIKDGDTIVAQAREIHSRNGKTVTDSFLARTTAGSGTIGDGVASLKSVGGNIVKNLVDGTFTSGWSNQNNVTHSIKNGVCTITSNTAYNGIRHNCQTISNHLYYLSTDIYTPNSVCLFEIGGGLSFNIGKSNAWQNISIIWKKTTQWWDFIKLATRTNSTSFSVSHFILIDLTEMYGAGNEPTKEECDKMFGTMDALPQGLTVANPTEFKSTGFNQFNPDNVLDGKAIANDAIVSGDKKIAVIPCLPCKVGTGENNGYCIHGEFGNDIKVYLTPLNPMEVDGELYMHELTKDATTDTYVPLIKGYMLVEAPTTANLCAHFLWSEDKCERDSYEPYFESKVELPTIPEMPEYGLAGIQTSGAIACDEIDFERDVYVKRIYKKVFNGSEIWAQSGSQFYTVGVKPINKGVNQLFNWNGYFKSSGNKPGSIILNNEVTASTLYIVPLESIGITDVATWKAYLANNPFEIYYELAEPEEYPLPKVDNNYISSDYGVEQFDGVVPCNANNLYYMRSLAGETRNFLDRLYDNTAKTDAKEVADYITNGIEDNKELATNAPNFALRALFVAAGAEYNDTDQVIKKTAFWGEEVDHLPKHYYLNGLGDITEEQMMDIYIQTYPFYNAIDMTKAFRSQGANDIITRTNLRNKNFFTGVGEKGVLSLETVCYSNTVIEVFVVNHSKNTITVSGINNSFINASKLKAIVGHISLQQISTNIDLSYTSKLMFFTFGGLKSNITISKSANVTKGSILYLVENAAPSSAITITLHHDAYVRLTADQEVLDALTAKNEALTDEGKGGKISLVCATHSEEITPNA